MALAAGINLANAAAIKVDIADKISDYRIVKAPQTVIKQTPAAGTPVVAGMTIEVQATSLSDVPIYVIDPNIVAVAKNVPVADAVTLIQNDDTLRNIAKTGVVNEADRQKVLQTMNAGLAGSLSGEMSLDDAVGMINSVGNAGLIEF